MIREDSGKIKREDKKKVARGEAGGELRKRIGKDLSGKKRGK